MEKLSALLGVGRRQHHVALAVTGVVHVVPCHPQRQWGKRGRKGGEQRGWVGACRGSPQRRNPHNSLTRALLLCPFFRCANGGKLGCCPTSGFGKRRSSGT